MNNLIFGILLTFGIGTQSPALAMARANVNTAALNSSQREELFRSQKELVIACSGDVVAMVLLAVPQSIPGLSLVEPAVAASIDPEFTIFPKKEVGESKRSHFARSTGNFLIVASGGVGAVLGDVVRNPFTGGRHQDLLGEGRITSQPATDLLTASVTSLGKKVVDSECKDAQKQYAELRRRLAEVPASAVTHIQGKSEEINLKSQLDQSSRGTHSAAP